MSGEADLGTGVPSVSLSTIWHLTARAMITRRYTRKPASTLGYGDRREFRIIAIILNLGVASGAWRRRQGRSRQDSRRQRWRGVASAAVAPGAAVAVAWRGVAAVAPGAAVAVAVAWRGVAAVAAAPGAAAAVAVAASAAVAAVAAAPGAIASG